MAENLHIQSPPIACGSYVGFALLDKDGSMSDLSLKPGKEGQGYLPLSKFTLFSSLPIDLRLLIWKQCLPGPRLIQVDCDISININIDTGEGKEHVKVIRPGPSQGEEAIRTSAFNPWYEPHSTDTRWSPASSIIDYYPSILHVCRESRKVAQSAYDWCFTTSVDEGTTVIMQPYGGDHQPERVVDPAEILSKGIFFQPAVDTVWICGWAPHLHNVLCSVRKSELKTDTIRSLALFISHYTSMKERFLAFDRVLFGGLEELILVAEEEDEVLTGFEEVFGVTKAREVMKADLKRRKRENPEIVLPAVRVMTQKMFEKWWPQRPSSKGLHGYVEDI
jgi:2EXR family